MKYRVTLKNMILAKCIRLLTGKGYYHLKLTSRYSDRMILLGDILYRGDLL